MRIRLLIALVSVFVASCAGGVKDLPPLVSAADTAYRLGAGDSLQIIVYGETDLTGSYKVADSGLVAMPLVGAVPAAGKSLDQFRQGLVDRLRASAIKSPDVTVSISEYRPFFILGEVKTPGSYAYVPNMTVLTAVAIAGGFTFRAAEDEVSVTRTKEGKSQEARAARDSRVLPGDVIYVFERHL